MLAYLSRYTHRVAISNSRLIAVDQRSVTFKVKDYRVEGPGRYTTMTLDVGEFIRRFLIHVLPKGFHRIRHYGLFASAQPRRDDRASAPTPGTGATPAAEEAVEVDAGGGAGARPALPLLRRPHARHRDLRCRLPTTPPSDRASRPQSGSTPHERGRRITHPHRQARSSLVMNPATARSATQLPVSAFRSAIDPESHPHRC